MPAGAQLSASRRSKWLHVTIGVTLILVAVALTVGWHVLGQDELGARPGASPVRYVVYFFGSLLFLLLIAGLVLIVILLLREVRLNERQSNFVSAVTHELKTPVASLKLYLDTLRLRVLNIVLTAADWIDPITRAMTTIVHVGVPDGGSKPAR